MYRGGEWDSHIQSNDCFYMEIIIPIISWDCIVQWACGRYLVLLDIFHFSQPWKVVITIPVLTSWKKKIQTDYFPKLTKHQIQDSNLEQHLSKAHTLITTWWGQIGHPNSRIPWNAGISIQIIWISVFCSLPKGGVWLIPWLESVLPTFWI